MSLAPLATPDDVAARLGRELTPAEQIRAAALLTDASAQIRRYCRRDFLRHTSEEGIFRCHDSEIQLPDQTTTAVHSVIAVGSSMGDGQLLLPDVPVLWYIFDGIDKIRVDPGWHGIINLPEIFWDDDIYPQTFRVSRDYGPAQVPDDVIAVAATAVIGVLTAPTQAAGLIGETIGPYSYRMERGGGGTGVALTQADLAGLKDFRLTAGTIPMRLR